MLMRTWTIYFAGSLLVGCAAPPAQMQLGPNHPANPNAAETLLPPRSDTLAINKGAQPSEPSTADMMPEMDMKAMGGMKHDMSGMQHDMSKMPNMPGMQHHDMGGMKHDVPATRPASRKSGASADPAEHGGHS